MGIWEILTGGHEDICIKEKEKPEETGEIPAASNATPPKKKLHIPLNKTTNDVSFVKDTIVFPCPVCSSKNLASLYDLDKIFGGVVMCQDCQNMLHVPGGYRTRAELKDLKIYAALPVAIRKFQIFYQNHPVINDLKDQRLLWTITQYGLWGFCQKCHTQFNPAVLMNIPDSRSDIIQIRSLIIDEMEEIRSLRQGFCPYCRHRVLLVIISEIPSYVISEIENQSFHWDDGCD